MEEYQKANENEIRPLLVGICGGSASGKTSVANVVYSRLGSHNCLLFSMDNYFKGPNPEERKNLEKYNFDCPYALDLDLLYQHLLCLLDNKEINMPVYEFRGSYRKNETIKVYPKRIILIEGILAFHDDRIRGLMDLKIFVNLGGDLRLTRRIERDIADRGRELMTIIERYLKFVKPAYETYIYPTKKYADLVIPKGAENSLGIDFVSDYLEMYLKKKYGEKELKCFAHAGKQFEDKAIFHPFNIGNQKEEDEKNEDLGYIHKKFDDQILSSFRSIFLNYLNEKKNCYYKYYVEYLCEKLYNLLSELEDLLKCQIITERMINEEKIAKINKTKKIIVFSPILLMNKEKLDLLFKEIKSPIIICSIFLSETCNKTIYEKNKEVKFISVYYGDLLNKYQTFIDNGGYSASKEYNLPEGLCPLTEINFETEFEKLIIHKAQEAFLSSL